MINKLQELLLSGKLVDVYLSDQDVSIINCQIIFLDLKEQCFTVKYETRDEEEVSSWEEMIKIGLVGSIRTRLSTVPLINREIITTKDCNDLEK